MRRTTGREHRTKLVNSLYASCNNFEYQCEGLIGLKNARRGLCSVLAPLGVDAEDIRWQSRQMKRELKVLSTSRSTVMRT